MTRVRERRIAPEEPQARNCAHLSRLENEPTSIAEPMPRIHVSRVETVKIDPAD